MIGRVGGPSTRIIRRATIAAAWAATLLSTPTAAQRTPSDSSIRRSGFLCESISRRSDSEYHAFLQTHRQANTDGSAVRGSLLVAVCVTRGASADPVGSYRAEVTFDTTAARLVGVENGTGGVRVTNANRAGTIVFAGADPNGFGSGPWLVLEFQQLHDLADARLQLRVDQLTSITARDVFARLRLERNP